MRLLIISTLPISLAVVLSFSVQEAIAKAPTETALPDTTVIFQKIQVKIKQQRTVWASTADTETSPQT